MKNKIAGIATYISIITPSINGLNSQNKRETHGFDFKNNKTKSFVAYKKYTLVAMTNIS
jgi:hypothetical protein